MDARDWFDAAATAFSGTASRVRAEQLDGPGLGEWDVRALIGHGSRAMLTVESYLGTTAGAAEVDDAAGYFRAARAGLADPAQVTRRGRDAGAALGENPAAAVTEIHERVARLVAAAADDAIVTTPVGTMRLIDYMPTRAFELTVHGIDLARATDQDTSAYDALTPAALGLLVDLADPGLRQSLLLAMTGRGGWPDGGFSL